MFVQNQPGRLCANTAGALLTERRPLRAEAAGQSQRRQTVKAHTIGQCQHIESQRQKAND